MRAICIQAVVKTMVRFSGQHYHGDPKKEQKFDNLISVHTYIYVAWTFMYNVTCSPGL